MKNDKKDLVLMVTQLSSLSFFLFLLVDSGIYFFFFLNSLFYSSEDQILTLIPASKPTTPVTDPVSTKFVLQFTDVLLPVFQKIVKSQS